MLVIIEKNAAELAKVDSVYSQIQANMPGFQRRGIDTSVDFVPIHSGLAKYVKERNAWDPKWEAPLFPENRRERSNAGSTPS